MTTDKYAALSDRELVALLLQEDSGAWDYLLFDVIAPLCRTRKYLEICKKFSIPFDSLVTAVWMILHKNDYKRLRIFRFGSSFKTYLYLIVREAQRNEVNNVLGKIPLELSEDDDCYTQIADRNNYDSVELKEELNAANGLLARLWLENPQQAWVLLMRNSLNLSSKEVAALLNESPANVDQLNSRAKAKMKQLSRM